MTPEGAYHDFWQCIVSGARGIAVFSYFHRRDRSEYAATWRMYNKAAAQVSGAEQLGPMILRGEEIANVKAEILAGALRTVEFKPHGNKVPPLSYPSVDLLAKSWNENIYVIAVNSAESWVKARINGLPIKAGEATLLFEEETVPVTDSTLLAEFGPLGVHIFKITK